MVTTLKRLWIKGLRKESAFGSASNEPLFGKLLGKLSPKKAEKWCATALALDSCRRNLRLPYSLLTVPAWTERGNFAIRRQ